MAFAKDQPKDGETILHCGHVGSYGRQLTFRMHWFRLGGSDGSIRFMRPDGSWGRSGWFAACEPCFIKHGAQVTNHVRGDGIWNGDEPAIEEVEKS